MYDHEKPDSVIVARNPMNKAEQSAADSEERRTETKRNADECSTHRTQGRECVSQALARVRLAAKQRKKEKFTALLHHINVDLMREAFLALKRNAAPGVDGVTSADYEADLEPRLSTSSSKMGRKPNIPSIPLCEIR